MRASIFAVGSGLVLTALAVFGGAGCAVSTDSSENVGSAQQALTSTDYFDAAGLVQIRVKTCDWTAALEHPVTTCSVDPGFVLVGGGAEVEGSASGGGLLTHSFPANKATWVAASKDHVVAFSHRLRAYAVGMALSGMDSTTLSNLVTINSGTSGASHAPSIEVAAPDFNILLSGGATANYQGAGQLLTDSHPASDNANAWVAASKDHQVSDVSTVTAYVISVPVCLNNQWPNGSCLNVTSPSNSTFVSTGYGLATVNTPAGWAPLGVGGRARWSGAGRLLTDLFPTNSVGGPGATAYSKDHDIVEGNTTDVWAMSVQGVKF